MKAISIFSIQLNRLYANAHGYKFRYADLNETDCSLMSNKLPPCKLYAVRDALHDPNIETVLYLIQDAVVTPKGRRISIKEFREANNVANASVIVPQDCDNYQMNTGVQIWDSNEKTHDLIDEFIERAKRYPKFPEQQALKVWANEPASSITSVLGTVPYGVNTWHVGSCRRGKYIAPQWVAHIAGRGGRTNGSGLCVGG